MNQLCEQKFYFLSEKGRLLPEKSEESIALLNGNLHCSILLSCLNLGFVRYLPTREKKINDRVKCAMNQTQF